MFKVLKLLAAKLRQFFNSAKYFIKKFPKPLLAIRISPFAHSHPTAIRTER